MTLIKSLLIPEFSNDLSQVIEKTVIKANESFMESRQIYEEAERFKQNGGANTARQAEHERRIFGAFVKGFRRVAARLF